MINIGFSVGEYDRDGDQWDDKIKIYFDERTIIRFENLAELWSVIEQLQKCAKEITEALK